ncbi:MAG: hypothetical protein KJ906_00100 [Nanoarchaeota archaeon]|nr:hypothetical protein [Nanoarchaeota archaeon]
MYHPAKVIEIFSTGKDIKSADTSIQVTLEMWDDNILTFQINSKLGKIAKEGDIVIVDYGMKSIKEPVPKHDIVKVLKGKKGEKMWKKYQDFLRKNKPSAKTSTPVISRPPVQYIG